MSIPFYRQTSPTERAIITSSDLLRKPSTVGLGLAGLGAVYLTHKARKHIANKAAEISDKFKIKD